jgi:uncharacterized protein (DUF849 family)
MLRVFMLVTSVLLPFTRLCNHQLFARILGWRKRVGFETNRLSGISKVTEDK